MNADVRYLYRPATSNVSALKRNGFRATRLLFHGSNSSHGMALVRSRLSPRESVLPLFNPSLTMRSNSSSRVSTSRKRLDPTKLPMPELPRYTIPANKDGETNSRRSEKRKRDERTCSH